MGQRVLQNERLDNIARIMTIMNTIYRIILETLNAPPWPKISPGSETWIVEAGQILQNENAVSSPRIKGRRNTIKIRTIYLIREVHFGSVIFPPGILYNISWRNPNGQTHPQKSLPKITPMRSTVPNAKKGKMRYPE